MEKTYVGNIEIINFESKAYGKTVYALKAKDDRGDMVFIGHFNFTLLSAKKEAQRILDWRKRNVI